MHASFLPRVFNFQSEMGEETCAFPPWLDLPEPLSELVLERLPLIDYICFAAVCPKWRSIHRGHRLRHAPRHPPMAKQLPWLIPRRLNRRRVLQCHSPSDRKPHRLPIPGSLHNSLYLASCRGWLLMLEDIEDNRSFLFNPVAADQILLPPHPNILAKPVTGAMSAPPTDPDCVVLLMIDSCAFLYPLNDRRVADWITVQLTPLHGLFGDSAVYCGGRFYYARDSGYELYAVDPFLQKATAQWAMRYPLHEASTDAKTVVLQEIGGELFLVQRLYSSHALTSYRVFKADLSRHEWARVETLGDHALFHYGACSVFLLAAEVGCKRNSIYACKKFGHDELGNDVFTWGAFDLGTGVWTEENTLTHREFGPWFLPTLESTKPAKSGD